MNSLLKRSTIKSSQGQKRLNELSEYIHGGIVQLHSSNVLLDKIQELESYVAKKRVSTRSKIREFLKDLKTIEPNLSILSLVNYLVDMHRDGLSLSEIAEDVEKTKKIFHLVDEYIKYIETDPQILKLFKSIHEVIHQRLNRAFHIYRQEFDLFQEQENQ